MFHEKKNNLPFQLLFPLMQLQLNDIQQLEQRYRATFINSLAGFRQAVLVGTQSSEGVNNVAVFNSLIHLGANPALYGFISRPDTVQRDTLVNIQSSGYYTFNYMDVALAEKVHQTSARYLPHESEFDMVGLEPSFIQDIPAPFVSNAKVKIGMKLEDIVYLPINGTKMVIGSIQFIQLDEQWVTNDGFVDLQAADTLIACGLDAYSASKPIARFPYAKPKTRENL